MNTLYIAAPRSPKDHKVSSFEDPTPIQACAAKFGHELVQKPCHSENCPVLKSTATRPSACRLCLGAGTVDRPCGCPKNAGVDCLCAQWVECPNCGGRGVVD